jgi:hypothetical protein
MDGRLRSSNAVGIQRRHEQQVADGERISATIKTHKALVARIYQDFLQSSKEKLQNPIEKQAKAIHRWETPMSSGCL